MSGFEDLNDQILTLTELSLSTTQAKIYLALVKTKSQTAQAISTLSSVSRPDVYRVLNQLQNLGLVEKIIAKIDTGKAEKLEKAVYSIAISIVFLIVYVFLIILFKCK